MVNILNAAVYCGTYNKYNNGSIEGAWIKLAEYPSKKKFLEACKELHKDEPDPEFMFQDWENIPTSMVGEGYIEDEVWHVINSIKKYAMDKADEFAEWCDDNGMESDYAALTEFMGYKKKEKPKKEKKSKDNPLQMSKEEIKKALDDAGVTGWDREGVGNVGFIQGKLILFKRPNIDTSFPFDDENEAAMAMLREFCNNSEKAHEYFINKNLRGEPKLLDYFLSDDDVNKPYYMCYSKLVIFKYPQDKHWTVDHLKKSDMDNWLRDHEEYEPSVLDNVDEELFHQFLLNERQKFEARLNSYIKRYGVEKCRYWSYWANA